MPIIKVWCLPKSEEKQLNALHQSIVEAVVSVEELGVKDEKDITCLFPPDMMKYGLGTEIIVEVTGLFDRPERTDIANEQVRQLLAERIGKVVKEQFPEADMVECSVYPFQVSQGFWTSKSDNGNAPDKAKEGVRCKCGEMPLMNETMNLEGPGNTVHWRLECPKCGDKGAPWRRSQFIAIGDWESDYHKR